MTEVTESNIDSYLLEKAILDRKAKTGKYPKAIIPVALYGMPYQIDRILEIANRNNIPVIDDSTAITVINTGASIDHECIISDYCHIAPHATLCGQVHVGEGTLMGVSSCAIPCVTIGSWCTTGAGSVVIEDISNNLTVFGSPAKQNNK